MRSLESRVRVDVVHALERLTRQPGRVEVVDIGHVGVEQIEALDCQAQLVGEVHANLSVPDRRRLRRDGPVLDERPWTEVPQPDAAGDAPGGFHGDRARDDPVERARDAIARRVNVGKPGTRERDVELTRHPRVDSRVIRPFETHAPARTAGFGDARVAHEEQFGVEAQVPQRDRRL